MEQVPLGTIIVLYILPAEEGKPSAGHELKGKPTANFPREEGHNRNFAVLLPANSASYLIIAL
jgi:hypothetical protein